MYGSHSRGLLAISFVVLAPIMLNSQSDRHNPAPDFAPAFTPRGARPPINQPSPVERFPALPQASTATLGTSGFPLIARAAGFIFSGTVTAIARRAAIGGQSVETVAITFHVQNAIRGAIPGKDLTISQWIGLWSGGQRYRVGERVLLFLYPPSKLGLTSNVGGEMGRFTVDSSGYVLFSAQHLSAFRADPVLGGKSRASLSDFTLAVHRASEEN